MADHHAHTRVKHDAALTEMEFISFVMNNKSGQLRRLLKCVAQRTAVVMVVCVPYVLGAWVPCGRLGSS